MELVTSVPLVGVQIVRFWVTTGGLCVLLAAYGISQVWADFQAQGYTYQLAVILAGGRGLCPPASSTTSGPRITQTLGLLWSFLPAIR